MTRLRGWEPNDRLVLSLRKADGHIRSPGLWVWATALAWEIGLYVTVPLGLVFGSAFQFLHVQSLKLGEPMSPPASLIRSQLN